MNEEPLISVIIPTYNRATLISRAIKSVFNQTYKNFELIIIDDGSTDNTKKVVDELSKKDQRIVYVYQENQGWPSALNKGLSLARGEYVAFLDSDDEWLPGKLEKQLNLFKKSYIKNLGLVSCNILIINAKTNKIKKFKFNKKKLVESVLSGQTHTTLSSILVPRNVFEKIGFIDENLKRMNDQDVWIRIIKNYDIDYIPQYLIKYYYHGGNISIQSFAIINQIQESIYLINKHKDIFEKYPQCLSYRLKSIGILYMLNGDITKAKEYFIRSVRICPTNFRVYLNILLSFLGKNIYKFFLMLKKRFFDISFS